MGWVGAVLCVAYFSGNTTRKAYGDSDIFFAFFTQFPLFLACDEMTRGN